MGEAADDHLDYLLRIEALRDDDPDEDWDDAYQCHLPVPFRRLGLSRNQLTAIRVKSGGATRAAHEVAGVLRHLLSLPR